MLEVDDSGEYDSEFRDLHHDWSTQGTLSGGHPIRQTRTKPIHALLRNGRIKRRVMVLNTTKTMKSRYHK